MPLPKNGTPWPDHNKHTEQMAEWGAWYSGDPDQLATFYGPRTGVAPHPNQFRGGLVGRVARWWWGVPTPAGESRAKLHVPLAADICATSADLLFSEAVKLDAGEGNTSLQQFLDRVQDAGLDAKLHEGAEVQAALGGVYLRSVWDASVSPLPWTETVHPDGAVPTFRNGRLAEVSLWTELPAIKSGTVHRMVEHHERGFIIYALFAGSATNLGKRVPVQQHPETEHLAELVAGGSATLDDVTVVQATGIDRLTVTYAPNMLPNRLDRRSLQGRSDLQGVTGMLDALDEAYSSWWRDIRHAKSRIHVPASYLESMGPGQAGIAEVDREVYVPLQGVLASSKDGLAMQVQQFAIRVKEHRETCEAWTKTIIESAGYSSQSLSGEGTGAVTAAEVHSHERRSYMTRGKKIRYWRAAITDHLAAQVDLANAHLSAGITPGELGVAFQDGVQESALSLANTALALRNAEAASVETRVAMVHPDWDADDVTAEAQRILAETGGAALPLPDDAGF